MSRWQRPLSPERIDQLKKFYLQSQLSKAELARRFNVDLSTANRHLNGLKRPREESNDLTEQKSRE